MTAERREELLKSFYAKQQQIIDALLEYMVPLYRYFAHELELHGTESDAEEALEDSAKRVSRLKGLQLRQIARILMEFRQAFEHSEKEPMRIIKTQLRELMTGFDYALLSAIAAYATNGPKQVFLLKERETVTLIKKIAGLISAADLDRETLFKGNWRLVAEIARRFQSFHCKLDLDELVQEGNTGLLAAIDKFNPCLNNQLSTLAASWIQAKIRRALDNLSETIRTPVYKRQRKKIVQRAEMEILQAQEDNKDKTQRIPQQIMTSTEKLFGRSVDDETIASRTGLSVEEVQELRRLYPETVSIHASIGGDSDQDGQERGDLIADKSHEEDVPSDEKADRKVFFDLLGKLVEELPLVHQVVLSGLNGLPIRKASLRRLVHEKIGDLQRHADTMGKGGLAIMGKAKVQIFK